MPLATIAPQYRLCPLAVAILLLSLTGCGINSATLASGSPAENAVSRSIQGHVHGGAYPIQGATVRLMETQSNGYGGAAAALLPPVTTDANGFFTFPNSPFTCTTGQFAYLTVSSGTTANLATPTLNNNVIQASVIGSCAKLTADFSNINVFLTEVSTVATAAALGNFITIDSTRAATGQQIVNISAPAANNAASPACTGGGNMICTAAGLAHAFANAYNLVDSVTFDGSFPSGLARVAVPSNPSASTVPSQLLNTLGNILQNCVDSVGGGAAGDGSYCGSLFALATPPVTGAKAPTNTLQVAMNMVKYPTGNTANLYTLQSRTPYFTPSLSSAPTSFAVSVFYGAEAASGNYVPYPVDLALDAADNVYILYSNATIPNGVYTPGTYGAVVALGPDGTQMFYGPPNTSLLFPTQIAVNSTGRVFVTNNDTNTLTNGGLFATAAGGTDGTLSQLSTLSNPSGIAVDRNDDIWISAANGTARSIVEYNKSTVANVLSGLLSTVDFASNVFGVPVTSVAIEPSQNVWGVSGGSGTSYDVFVPQTGTVLAPLWSGGVKQSLGNTGGYGLAINSASNVYFPNYQQLDSATASGGNLSTGANGTKTVSASGSPQRAQVDGAGNLFWANNQNSGLLYEFSPAASGSLLSAGTVSAFLPCYPYPGGSGYACVTSTNTSPVFTPTNLRSLAIDSAGDVWYVADAGVGTVVETLGLAAPTWPQLSYGHPGCTPGITTTSCP